MKDPRSDIRGSSPERLPHTDVRRRGTERLTLIKFEWRTQLGTQPVVFVARQPLD